MTDRSPQAEGGVTMTAIGILPHASVDTSYFRVMRIGILEGRDFDAADLAEGAHAVILDLDFARALWPDGSAVGRRLQLSAEEDRLTVVGVSEDVKLMGPDDASYPYAMFRATTYSPVAHSTVSAERLRGSTIAIRTAGPSNAVIESVREAIRSLDPDIPVPTVERAQSTFSEAIDQPRFVLWMMSVFAAVALILAAIGIYGLVSFMVARRTREIGCGTASGARDRQILGAVLGNGIAVALAGLGAGTLGALVLSGYIADLLFDVPAMDGLTIAAVSAVLLFSCAFALLLPARRAARVAAAEAMRET
jgi:putative ABC transport system permease protein